jgi:hypothetical protein
MTRGKIYILCGMVGLLLIVMAAGLIGGCTSMVLPRSLSDAELARVRSTRFNVSVGVAKDENPLYSDRLVRALRRTRLFGRVERLEEVPNADLVARVDRHIYGTATIPILTGLSLGFIPTVTSEEWGEAFTLHANPKGNSAVTIEFTYRGATVLGWAAGFWNISSDRTSADPRKTQRFVQAFASAVCAQEGDIRRLIGAR